MNAVHETKEKNWVSSEDVRPNLLQFCNQSQARVQQDTRLFFGLFNGFSTMTTHNDIRTYLMHPACFPGHAQMLQTASAAFGRFDLHLVWSALMLVIKIHWKWSLDISLRTHKKNTWNAHLLHTAGQRFVNICCCFKAVTGREINLFFLIAAWLLNFLEW